MKVTLEDARVVRATEKAVLVAFDGEQRWIPRSVCLDGDALNVNDTDICVEKWFAETQELPF